MEGRGKMAEAEASKTLFAWAALSLSGPGEGTIIGGLIDTPPTTARACGNGQNARALQLTSSPSPRRPSPAQPHDQPTNQVHDHQPRRVLWADHCFSRPSPPPRNGSSVIWHSFARPATTPIARPLALRVDRTRYRFLPRREKLDCAHVLTSPS